MFKATIRSEYEDRSKSRQDDRYRYARQIYRTDDNKSGTCGCGNVLTSTDKKMIGVGLEMTNMGSTP
eukprot:1086461-Heterocapsa_arctica.AAC.1